MEESPHEGRWWGPFCPCHCYYFPARQTQAHLEPAEKLLLRPFAANIKTKFLTTVSNALHNSTTTKRSRFKSLSFLAASFRITFHSLKKLKPSQHFVCAFANSLFLLLMLPQLCLSPAADVIHCFYFCSHAESYFIVSSFFLYFLKIAVCIHKHVFML